MRVVGTTLGRLHRPHLLEAWGQRFNLQMDDEHLALFRYSDVPGHGRPRRHRASASTASTSPPPPSAASRRARTAAGADVAVMAVTTDAPVPQAVIDEIVASDGFVAGRALSLRPTETREEPAPASAPSKTQQPGCARRTARRARPPT